MSRTRHTLAVPRRRPDSEGVQRASSRPTAAPLHTLVTNLARGCAVLLALVAVAGVVGVSAARADEPVAKLAFVDKLAGSLGFADSHAPGFWEALTKARADELEALKKQADAERAEQAKQFVEDASKYGRRVETTVGTVTSFTEYIPPASGDIIDDVTVIRIGHERVLADGTKKVFTKYLKPNSVDSLGFVESVVKDEVETVTNVQEYEKGSIDVKVGDTRPVAPPSSSAVGKKPHTIDPKADGSLGRASGNHPDAPAEVAETDKAPSRDSVVRAKVELADGGSRVEFEPIKLSDGRVFMPFHEVRPTGSPFRTGYDLASPSFDGAFVRVAAYLDRDGKLDAVVTTVLKKGLETVVTTDEFKPGALGGLKPGDTRPFDSSGGKKPPTWNPPADTGSGGKSGGTQSSGDASPNGSGPAWNEGRPKSEPASGDKGGDSPSSDTPAQTTPSSSEGSTPEYEFLGVGPKRENEDGSTSQNTLYKRTSDGVLVQTITTTQKDGTQSQEQHCKKDSEEVDCGGMTVEPTCSSSCDHLAVFIWLVGCTGTECDRLPEAASDHRCEAIHPARDGEGRAGYGQGGSASDSGSSVGGPDQGSPRTSGVSVADCDAAGRRGGGPIDYGNPHDPNAPDPVDTGQPADPRDDGVTDPANPGEGKDGPTPVAILDDGEKKPDLGGELRDPVDPAIADSGPPGDGPPRTGDAERIHAP